MTAEFAVSLPAVILVLALCLGGVRVGVQAILVQDAAATAARLLSRGELTATAAAAAVRIAPDATLQVSRMDGLVCATVSARGAGVIPIPARGRACALEG